MNPSPSRRRLRSASVGLGLTALVAASLTGCAMEEEPDYAAICVDPDTGARVDDDQCDDDVEYTGGGGSGFFWFYMATSSNHRIPAVGQTFDSSSGSYRLSSLAGSSGSRVSVQRGGLPTAGASSMSSYVRSGGFGSRGGFASS